MIVWNLYIEIREQIPRHVCMPSEYKKQKKKPQFINVSLDEGIIQGC